MEPEETSSKVLPLLKKYWLPLCLGLFGMIFILYGLISLTVELPKNRLEFSQESPKDASASKTIDFITIDIEGAVSKPGVYKLNQGAIVQDALIAANGLAKDADREYVSKNLNLAAKLTEAQKIYIPKIGEVVIQVQDEGVSNIQGALININTALARDLEGLPGVGPVTAGKIISARPYVSIEDLQSKKILSPRVFDEIKGLITAY